MTRITLLVACLLTTLIFVGGCSVMKAFEKHDVALELVVRATSSRLLTANPEWALPAKLITASALKMLDDDPLTSLDALEQAVVQRIDWGKLTPEEQTLLQVLIAGVRRDLEEHFRQKGISNPGAASVRAGQILQWINETAALRTPQAECGGPERCGKGSSLHTYAKGSQVLAWAGGCGA